MQAGGYPNPGGGGGDRQRLGRVAAVGKANNGRETVGGKPPARAIRFLFNCGCLGNGTHFWNEAKQFRDTKGWRGTIGDRWGVGDWNQAYGLWDPGRQGGGGHCSIPMVSHKCK